MGCGKVIPNLQKFSSFFLRYFEFIRSPYIIRRLAQPREESGTKRRRGKAKTFERKQIDTHESYSSRKGKRSHSCMQRLTHTSNMATLD